MRELGISEKMEQEITEIIGCFERAGINDPVWIAEHVAFFLLCKLGGRWDMLHRASEESNMYVRDLQKYFPEHYFQTEKTKLFSSTEGGLFQPSAPSGMQRYDLHKLLMIFDLSTEIFQNLSYWFNNALLPRLFKRMQGGGQYATPRHLNRFMAGLVRANKSDTLADFACGTGGMFVAAGRVKSVTGIEISPNMARLAFTNLVLLDQDDYSLHLGNAFYTSSSGIQNEKFDVVLMNPPFGAKIDPALFEQTFQMYRFKGSSETMFALLAYDRLKPDGRMAIMVPSSVLFSTNRSDVFLRETLLSNGALQAIISLPRDSVQPYSNVDTHILFARKSKDELDTNKHQVWFYRALYDGLTSGRNRKQDNEHNDLALIEVAFSTQTSSGENIQITPLSGAIDYDYGGENGYRIECEKGFDFGVREIGGGFWVEVIQEQELIELIYIDDEEKVYRGVPKLEPLPMELPFQQTLTGKFNLLGLIDVWEETPKYSLLLENGYGEIRKGKLENARFGVASKDEQNAIGVLIDENQIISPLIQLTIDKLSKNEILFGYSLVMEEQNERKISLIILDEKLSGYALLTSTSDKRYLLPQTTNYILMFYDAVRNQLKWSVTVDLNPDGSLPVSQDAIFRSDPLHRGVVFTQEGRVLGIGVPSGAILDSKGFELQWEKYWPAKRSQAESREAAQILGDIKIAQNKLTASLDRLLGIAELKPVGNTELPPRLQFANPSPNLLHGIQQKMWEIIQRKTEQFGDYLTPIPFQADDIQPELHDTASVMDVQRTLELFERMGLIVAAVYSGYEKALYYRLPIESDLVGASV